MKPEISAPHRIIAIQPTSRGFGYALLDAGTEQILDAGIRRVRPIAELEQRTLPKVAELIERCAPGTLLVEDTRHPQCRRQGHAKAMIEGIVEVAEILKVRVCPVPGRSVRTYFRKQAGKNKDRIAALIADQFPRLRPILPPPRSIWKPPHDRMAIFDAVALSIFFLRSSANSL